MFRGFFYRRHLYTNKQRYCGRLFHPFTNTVFPSILLPASSLGLSFFVVIILGAAPLPLSPTESPRQEKVNRKPGLGGFDTVTVSH